MMVINKFINKHNGVTYTNLRILSNDGVAATACFNDERLILKGLPKATITKGSYKFNEEIQFSITAPKGSIVKEKRNNSKWDTIELCMPLEVGKELINKLQEELNDTRPQESKNSHDC